MYDIAIDMDSNKAIYVISADNEDKLFLNSSLAQFVGYLSAYIEFVNRKCTAFFKEKRDVYLLKRVEYIREWEKYMIDEDSIAYYHKQYYWGSILEEHENGMFL